MFTKEFKDRLDEFVATLEVRVDILKMLSMKSEMEYKRETSVIDEIEELSDVCFDTVSDLMKLELEHRVE